MKSASPTTSNSTGRGGRPKDWTDHRARKLVRLYVYTRLPFDLILQLLEDGVWKPGKDAANKVKNSLLGNDPRWMRPKDEADERRRIAGLEESRRASMLRRRSSTSHSTKNQGHDDDSMTLAHSHQPSFEKADTPAIFQLTHPSINPGFPVETGLFSDFGDDDDRTPRFTPGTPNAEDRFRQNTGLTDSTETSISNSFREKLCTVPRDQVKRIKRVFKAFTFPKNLDPPRASSFSPELLSSPQFPLDAEDSGDLDKPVLHDAFSASYAVPGDFLGTDLSKKRGKCEIGSASHKSKICWCRIADQIMHIQDEWANFCGYLATSINSPEDFSRHFTEIDPFGNTAFHFLAATDGDHRILLNIISNGLSNPLLPVRATNTAGQTLLHVLHRSWYDDESGLVQLLNMLKGANFDILATDVYGRSFFHLFQTRKQEFIRIPPSLVDWNLLRRRDAFGVKPADSCTSRHVDYTATLLSPNDITRNTVNPNMTALPLTRISIPSDDGEEAWIRPQTELLKTVVNAVSVDPVNSTIPDPRIEDSYGRNALHCLAEVELDVERLQTLNRESRRQKRPRISDTSGVDSRLEYLEGLLHANVDVNHYDNKGQTPLMAFVRHRQEDSKGDMRELENIIKMLHNAGAELEKRNRYGETALHIAARSGQKYTMKVLLGLGANPYTRNAHGMSLLDMIDQEFLNSEGDAYTVSRLEACRAWISSKVLYGSSQKPTVLDEWGVKREFDSMEQDRMAID
ncbi:ankyrin [Xylariaceae sp. FL0662B]|nr:ankyrin [Xylariaceae sp. FL0662B]